MKALLIAAGSSSRFWPLNGGHKSFCMLAGHPMIYWTVRSLQTAGIEEAVVVCAPGDISFLQEALKDAGMPVRIALQEEPRGTGDAVWQAKEFLEGEAFFAVWPYYGAAAGPLFRLMQERRERTGCRVVLGGAETANPSQYGVFRMEGNRVLDIVEKPAPGTEPSNIKHIGCKILDEEFFSLYERLPSHGEFALTDALAVYLREGSAEAVIADGFIPDLKYPWDLLSAMDALFQSPLLSWDTSVSVEGAEVRGDVIVEDGAVIKAGTVIEGPAYIGPGCEIGPHNVLRGPLSLEANVKTGAFCEIKHSIIQQNTHLHSGYVGDSLIAEECRIGAGFITANKRLDRARVHPIVKGARVDSGRVALGAVIGKGSRIGIHAGTMPGTMIGKECLIGPGTQVRGVVPDGTEIGVRGERQETQ